MFRFTIRELVLLTLVVALGLSWWMDQWQLRTRLTKVELLWHYFEQFNWDQDRLHQRNEQIVGLFLDAGGSWTQRGDGKITSLQLPVLSHNESNNPASAVEKAP